MKTTKLNLKKLDNRTMPMVLISYEPSSKAYRMYDPVSKRVNMTCDVVFDEEEKW